MKKIFLSLTATVLLCGALPQQTLAGCFGNSKQSGDTELGYGGGYTYSSPYDNEPTQPSNACIRFLSNAYDAIASAGNAVLQHPLFDTTPKRVVWVVVGGAAIASPWLVPAVATAIAPTATTLAPFSGQNDSFILDNNGTTPFPALTFTTTPEPSKPLIEDAIDALQQNGSLPLEMAQGLTPEEASAIMVRSQEWSDDPQFNGIKIVSGNRNCTALVPNDWERCVEELSQPETTTTTTTTTTATLSPLVEGILSGRTPINFMKASDFRNLVPSEKEKVNQHWRENQTPDTPFYFIEEGIPCRVDMPIDVNFCRTGTVNTMSNADIDTAVKAQAITLEMISTIPPYRIDARINAGGKWSQYLYNKEGKYLRKNGSNVYFYSMPELRSKWNLPWNILMEGKDTEDAKGNTYTWH